MHTTCRIDLPLTCTVELEKRIVELEEKHEQRMREAVRPALPIIAAPQCGQTQVDETMASGIASGAGDSATAGTTCSNARAWARCSRRAALASRRMVHLGVSVGA